MTKLDALRRLVTAPRDHHHQGRIGRVQKYARSDGREKIDRVYRILRAVARRTA
jgi:hypothetical protein